MLQLTPAEHMRTVWMRMEQSRRALNARLRMSNLFKWRYGAPIADELVIVPQDLRTGDPSFFDEIKAGQFGLSGFVAELGARSPFDIAPPNDAWARELHGFSWLRNLHAEQSEEADRLARAYVTQWIRRSRRFRGLASAPEVTARRVISWINAAHALLDENQPDFELVADNLADQIIHLSATWRSAPAGYPRLLALTALNYANLCIAGRQDHLADAEQQLSNELKLQILPDGGHISRNPGVLLDVLLDLLPLNQCYRALDRTPPPALQSGIERMIAMVQFMRLGDGTLARFNGVGPPADDAIATIVGYVPLDNAPLTEAPNSRYEKVDVGNLVLILDAGPAPPLAYASQAHAGCLSFELCSGTAPIFINAGRPGVLHTEWGPAARATASHNALVIGAKSSSRLVRHALLEDLIGAAPIRFPARVNCSRTDSKTNVSIVADHDGYGRLFRLIHERSLTIEKDGSKLAGTDTIRGAGKARRLAVDLPVAVHFHLERRVDCKHDNTPNQAILHLRNGERWRFHCENADLQIEDSIHFAETSGPSAVEQIVLRTGTAGETTIKWQLERF